ncbi:putative protein kinase X [Monocercomonoides exilis]|uniref:putative protein kinase X n=1 Tax=Monocercomonoides exilis TaxID=2049356 RepID=UPI0035596D4C|nr:putative protein kinase X [Monocercomonoides exilis]|eukprot:MONOS_4031.1-p1 / transcript=MONOS_4031.1 / gene=MONOS_4031 / organism=Monocercomonoides_exilis_PA203 / gene_product=serine / transcript_product=serine / location=Mono_scaffold00102:40768-42260(+) / protein_length=414 / sequence_SO=supercontig / SO=protein_coding / is_pseudo=false
MPPKKPATTLTHSKASASLPTLAKVAPKKPSPIPVSKSSVSSIECHSGKPPVTSVVKEPAPPSYIIASSSSSASPSKLSESFQFTRKPRLDEFKMMQIIGSGTFGIIQIAQHKESQQYFAMKVMDKKRICLLKQARHMKYEREILLRCRHPRIVRLFETMQDENNIYLILEYCPSGDFFTLRETYKTIKPSAVRHYAAQLVTAFARLHAEQIAYRDLKPENLLLDGEGQLKLTDLGFAKEITDLSFTICGTAEYVAPELVLCTGHDKGVDWWALGILIYELLMGNPPFFGTPIETYEAIVKYRPPMKEFENPEDDEKEKELRAAAKALVLELLRKDKTKRLGCLHGGAEDVKNHPFFAGIDWAAMENGLIPAPIPPNAIPAESAPAIIPEDPEIPPGEIDPTDPDQDPSNLRDF